VSGALRLFVAAEPPEAVCAELERWTRHAVGAPSRRLAADLLHLTLCFLGPQPATAVGELSGVLGAVVEELAAVEELIVGAPVWLPPRRPRVLAVEVVDPAGALHALHRALVVELEATLGWRAPRERYRPHITVARMRGGSERPRALPPTPALSFAPAALTLFRSTLDPAGATYTAMASIPLR
jgi:2'-5' RNA ligase